MSVLGYSRSSRSYVGLRARAMALALVSARYPQPSRMMRTSGLGRVIGSQLSALRKSAPRICADERGSEFFSHATLLILLLGWRCCGRGFRFVLIFLHDLLGLLRDRVHLLLHARVGRLHRLGGQDGHLAHHFLAGWGCVEGAHGID